MAFKVISRFIIGIALSVLILPLPAIAQCNWIELIARSFLSEIIQPRGEVGEFTVASLNKLNLSEFNTFMMSREIEAYQQYTTVINPEIDQKLNQGLTRLYQAAEKLYGVRLDPKVRMVDNDSINAFATGSEISMNSGLMAYFLNPKGYWKALGFPRSYQASFSKHTNWKNDWEGVYGILAHEAAHNVMRHSSRGIVAILQETTEQYGKKLMDERKEIAKGKKLNRIKGFFHRSLAGAWKTLEFRLDSQTQEREADAVAMILLAQAGYDSRWAYRANEKLTLYTSLRGAAPQNWKEVFSEALCSTHPAWQERLSSQAKAFSCLQSTKSLCDEHYPFPLAESLEHLRAYPRQASAYREETLRIANSVPDASTPRHQVRIRLRPKGAQLEIDGSPSKTGKVHLALGPHVLRASKEGFQPTERQIVVFPDFQPKVRIKLKKMKTR